jgi:hypothetical protein
MATSFSAAHSAAWIKLGMGTREVPGEIFPKFIKKDFEDLKAEYNKEFGYTVRIPQWDDIIHLEPTALKTKDQIKDEKKEALVRILESPAPEWARKYSTVMTWIDNIQDTSSVVIPLINLLWRAAPKIMSKFLGAFGWVLLGYDLLNLANAVGRAPLTPMKSKREICRYVKGNPFTKFAQWKRTERIKSWKPNLADFIQAAQVSDQFTGVGLSLGGIMGAITDSFIGAYRYATGEPVHWSTDPPDVSTLDKLGARGLRAASAIGAQGQVFSELTHFWTYITGSLSSMLYSGTFRDESLSDIIINPMEMMIPAPEPEDPLTIEVINDMGLNVQEGIGWPWNDKKFISAGDYIDATVEPCRANFVDYCFRHSKDSYGLIAAAAMDSMTPQIIGAIDPEASYHVDDTNEMKVFWKMIKAPLLPSGPMDQEKYSKFISWVNDFSELYKETPGIMLIEEKFKNLGIPYITSYPSTPQPGFENFWPEGWTGNESF